MFVHKWKMFVNKTVSCGENTVSSVVTAEFSAKGFK